MEEDVLAPSTSHGRYMFETKSNGHITIHCKKTTTNLEIESAMLLKAKSNGDVTTQDISNCKWTSAHLAALCRYSLTDSSCKKKYEKSNLYLEKKRFNLNIQDAAESVM